VAAHWAGPLLADMVECHRRGDVDKAMRINQCLAESYRFESSDDFPNPVPAKAACRALGLPVGQCRLPNAPAPDHLDEQARSVIAGLGRLTPERQSVA
jgi:4-hydroxy-tetrahydrodipicolinate synthase